MAYKPLHYLKTFWYKGKISGWCFCYPEFELLNLFNLGEVSVCCLFLITEFPFTFKIVPLPVQNHHLKNYLRKLHFSHQINTWNICGIILMELDLTKNCDILQWISSVACLALKNEPKGASWIECVGLKFNGLFTSVRWELRVLK